VFGVLATIATCAHFFTVENFEYGSIYSVNYYYYNWEVEFYSIISTVSGARKLGSFTFFVIVT
jgi:hypothetical protein